MAGIVLTALAALLVLFALLAPDQVGRIRPAAFARIPAEGLVGVVLVLILPDRARRAVTVLAGLALGLLTVVKIVNLGFYAVLDRPFDLVLDWRFFGNAADFVRESSGQAGAIGAEVAAAVLAVLLVVLIVLSLRRLSGLVVGHRRAATRSVAVLAVAWLTCAVLGVQIVAGEPVAARSAATLAYDSARQVNASLRDREVFASRPRSTSSAIPRPRSCSPACAART